MSVPDAGKRQHERHFEFTVLISNSSAGFHTAELEPSDRNIVVELFIAKHIHAVFCTSTLAAGVNLPSFLVIIKGTSLFAGGADKNREYSAIDLQQMAGRAGRPQFDTEGVCAIMTSDDRVDHFKGAMTAKIPIESKMKAKLMEHLNAEIVLETIADIAQAVEWVCSTFYFTRASASPRLYLGEDKTKLQVKEGMRREVLQALNELAAENVIKLNEDGFTLCSTPLGVCMAKFYLNFETIKKLRRMPENLSEEEALILLSDASEFDHEFAVRLEEKAKLKAVNSKNIRFKIKTTPGGWTTSRKISAVLQAQLTGVPIDDWKLQLQANQIFNVSSRITRAMVEIALQSMQMQTCVSILKLEQAVETRCYPEFSTIWSQFDAIGQKHSTALFSHVKTIPQLKTFDFFQIECLIGKATAQKLKESVSKLPTFVPQLMNVRFVDRNIVTQDCKWEVQIEIQRSYTPQECRVNVLAGLWHGAASLVKRHYLLQESGPANSMTFTVTSKSNDRNLIIHLAVLSCTHAGIDREIIYKCAINFADAKKPSAGHIDEINEKTLEVLAKKKSEMNESKDFSVEEFPDNDRFHESQSTQAKRKPKTVAAKDHDIMSTDDAFRLTEKQLGLLPNKALKTVGTIKKKQAEHQLELTDDENHLAFEQELFEQELFKQMDYPKSPKHNYEGLNRELKVPHRREVSSVKVGMVLDQSICAVPNEGTQTPNQIEKNFSSLSKEASPVEVNSSLRYNRAIRMERLSCQAEIREPIRREVANPFSSFAYIPMQSDTLLLKDHQALKNKREERVFTLPSEQLAISSPKKINFDADRSLPATPLQGIIPFSEVSRIEGSSWHNVIKSGCENYGNAIKAKSINEPKLPTAPNAGLVQVVCLQAMSCCAQLRFN